MITKRVKWQPGVLSVADFLESSENGRLEIQPDFQRKEVWSKSAKIMLIDSILWNVPMPKILVQTLIRGRKRHMKVVICQRHSLSSPKRYKIRFFRIDWMSMKS